MKRLRRLPIALRHLLLIPGSWRWNGWVRSWTAELEVLIERLAPAG